MTKVTTAYEVQHTKPCCTNQRIKYPRYFTGIRDIAEEAHEDIEEIHRACELEEMHRTCADVDSIHIDKNSSPRNSIT